MFFDFSSGTTVLPAREIVSAAKLLFAAVVRDFWVVEERDQVFATSTERRSFQKRKPDESPRVVYLPRVRYARRISSEKMSEQLAHGQRGAHLVAGHLRKAESPSQHQLVLASRYGVSVPSGHTFVRPHERGGAERSKVYRSRSALGCLFEARVVSAGTSPASWFLFERDVQAWLIAAGFQILDVRPSARGDAGVDIYAIKGSGLEEIRWIVQCKCYDPDRRIGPAIVRELVGAIQEYPTGTRGMVITTSQFSLGAIELAKAHNIMLIDGAQFVSRSRVGN